MDKLSEDQIAVYRGAFKMFDKDGDGTITKKELGTVLKKLNKDKSKSELKTIMNEVDKHGKGTLNFNDFLEMMASKSRGKTEEEDMHELFRLFDADNNGFITPSELKHVMLRLGQKLTDVQVGEMVTEADLDGDGLINYEEFVRMMKM